MKLPKFKRDDLVETPLKTKCRIRKFYVKDNVHYYEVELLDTYNKGDIREFEETMLSFHYNMHEGTKKKDNIPSECPKCGSKWHVSRFGMRKWYDCPKCEDKAENLCKMALKTDIPPIPQDTNHSLAFPDHKDDLHDFIFDFDDDDDLFLKIFSKLEGTNAEKVCQVNEMLRLRQEMREEIESETTFTVPHSGMYSISGKIDFANGSTIQLPVGCRVDENKLRGMSCDFVIIDDPLANIELSEEEEARFNKAVEDMMVFGTASYKIDFSEPKKKGYTRQLTDFDLYYIKDEEKL